mgnify:CR=1 FL=1
MYQSLHDEDFSEHHGVSIMNKQGHDHWQAITASGPDDFKFLRKAWFDGSGMYFNDDQQDYVATTYGYIGNNESGYAILPYGFKKRGPFKFAMLAGEFFPRRGIPHSSINDDLVKKTADYLSAIKDVCGFRFGPVIKDDPFIDEVVKTLDKKGWRFVNSIVGQDFGMAVPKSFDDYHAELSVKRQKKIAYYRRRLEATGTVLIKKHSDLTVKEWKNIFAELEKVESKAWVANEGDPHFIGPNQQLFWVSLVGDDWFKKAINVWMLYLDSEPVSYLVSLDTGTERYILATAYDEAVAKYSTGHRLQLEMLKSTIDEGEISYINNGLGNSGYKDAWGAEKYIKLADIVAFPPTLRGKIAYIAAKLMNRFAK